MSELLRLGKQADILQRQGGLLAHRREQRLVVDAKGSSPTEIVEKQDPQISILEGDGQHEAGDRQLSAGPLSIQVKVSCPQPVVLGEFDLVDAVGLCRGKSPAGQRLTRLNSQL